MKVPVPERPAGGGPLRTSPPVRTVPIPDRGAPWGSRREACKLRSHPHPSRPSVVPPSPLKGEGSGGRPLRRSQKPSLLFRRGRTLAGPLRGCHFEVRPHPPRFARHLSPPRGKARAADSRPYGVSGNNPKIRREGQAPPLRFLRNSSGIGWGRPLGLPPGFAPVATYSAKPGAAVGSRQPQFWNSQGPAAREESRRSLGFCAPEILQNFSGGALVSRGPGVRRIWAR